jgi:C4-dicarboxylate-specific signal transduction histidine kinase
MGYDITEQKENEKLLEQNTLTLEFAKNELEILNNSLEKRIKSEIEKSTKQQALIMEQSKLVQMGEMIQNIAHQWRQPLSQINSTLMLLDVYLNKKNCMNDVVEEKISEIEELTSYLSHTIDDFQNFFKPNKHKTLFKISDALHKSLNIVKGQIDFHKIEIVDNINKDLEINGQKEELQQVLLVLINNAIDALVLNKISNPKIVFGNILENNILTIIVEDNALGIKEENIKRIFEPYFTTKYKSKGTGVGLYIAKMILQNSLYGDLSVENINDVQDLK